MAAEDISVCHDGGSCVERAGIMEPSESAENLWDSRFSVIQPAFKWGVEIAGGATPSIVQPNPAQLEVFRTEEDIHRLATGYKTIQKSEHGIDAWAEIAYRDNVVFRVRDRWSVSGTVVSVRREVEVVGNTPGGFDSSVMFTVDPSISRCELPRSGRAVRRPHLQRRQLAWRHAELRRSTLRHARGHSPRAFVRAFISERHLSSGAGPVAAWRLDRRGNKAHTCADDRCAISVWRAWCVANR